MRTEADSMAAIAGTGEEWDDELAITARNEGDDDGHVEDEAAKESESDEEGESEKGEETVVPGTVAYIRGPHDVIRLVNKFERPIVWECSFLTLWALLPRLSYGVVVMYRAVVRVELAQTKPNSPLPFA